MLIEPYYAFDWTCIMSTVIIKNYLKKTSCSYEFTDTRNGCYYSSKMYNYFV